MSDPTPARTSGRVTRFVLTALLVLGLVLVFGELLDLGGVGSDTAPAERLASPVNRQQRPSPSAAGPAAFPPTEPLLLPPRPPRSGRSVGNGSDEGATTDEGHLPDGTTVFDNQYPGIRRLDPDLLAALRAAARDAADHGVVFEVNSGWRSADYQNRLLRQAIIEYGSEGEALRWVTTAENSEHVTGNAVDLGLEARRWLADHGARYGLCQIYANEPWHYELRPDAIGNGCPAMFPDAAHGSHAQP